MIHKDRGRVIENDLDTEAYEKMFGGFGQKQWDKFRSVNPPLFDSVLREFHMDEETPERKLFTMLNAHRDAAIPQFHPYFHDAQYAGITNTMTAPAWKRWEDVRTAK